VSYLPGPPPCFSPKLWLLHEKFRFTSGAYRPFLYFLILDPLPPKFHTTPLFPPMCSPSLSWSARPFQVLACRRTDNPPTNRIDGSEPGLGEGIHSTPSLPVPSFPTEPGWGSPVPPPPRTVFHGSCFGKLRFFIPCKKGAEYFFPPVISDLLTDLFPGPCKMFLCGLLRGEGPKKVSPLPFISRARPWLSHLTAPPSRRI